MNRRLLPLACCLLLAACSEGQNARDLLGLGRNTPDEFKVVSRPPLSVPPDFALRPPAEGVDTTNLPPADLAARSMITGNDEEIITGEQQTLGDAESSTGIVQSFDLESEADEGFLTNIGAGAADSGIRETLDKETADHDKAVQEELGSAFGWLKPNPEEDEILDAEEEKERLTRKIETGEPSQN